MSIEKEQLAEFVRGLIIAGHITYDELLQLLKEATSRMLGEPKEKIFKE